MVVIKDVAKRCGYSVCTISRAPSGRRYLKEETRQKILEAAVGLGYRPNTLAVSLKIGRRQALALVLPSLTNTYYAKLGQYLESCALEKGYTTYLSNTEHGLEKEKQISENLVGVDIAGVITTPVASQYDRIMSLAKYDIPYMYLNRSFEDGMKHYLRLDNEKAAYETVSYMIKLGHRDIDGIFQSPDNLIYRECYDGMAQVLREHELDCRPDHVLFDVNPEDMGTTPGRVLQLPQKTDHPETIFTCDDTTAFNICQACYILGLWAPDHLSVFGYDNCIMASYVTPPLSTVSIPARKLTGTVIGFIHGYLESGVRVELPILKASLITRNSVRNLNLDQSVSVSFPEYAVAS